jgi:hypothetical protein
MQGEADGGLPILGSLILISIIYQAITTGFSLIFIPAAILCCLFFGSPLLTRRQHRRIYRKSKNLHGTIRAQVTEERMRFQGETFSAEIDWPHFHRFAEDAQSFLIYHSPYVASIIPKRHLSNQQATFLSKCFQEKIGLKGK